jgi:pimeloyl-ACP methyl ester carboxylesterase
VNALPIAAADASLRYIDLPGEEPALVFLHGLGSASSFSFPEIAAHPRLRARRSILVDFLGFGYSDRPATFGYSMEDHAAAVAELLDHLRIGNGGLVAHSMGGAISILVAAERPKRVGRLVIAEGNLDPQPGIVSGIVTSQEEKTYVETGHEKFVATMRAAGFAGYACTVEIASPLAMHRSAVDLIADRTPTFRDVLYSLSIPRRFLISEESKGDPDVEQLPREGIPVSIVPASGHDMMSDNPDGFAEAVADAIS